METRVSVTIDAPAEDVWAVATDIEGTQQTISGVEKIEVLERPPNGFVGFKWRETRTMAGKQAVETMWITEAVEPSYYVTEARSHGSIYRTRIDLDEAGGRTTLRMFFSGEPQTFLARFFAVAFGWLVKRSVAKALQQDLEDVKAAVESRSNAPNRRVGT